MSVFIEASAGTGKTTRLVRAIADAITEGVPVERIAAVTYTHQAAGGMKLKVRERLQAIDTPAARQAVQGLDRAFIGTIHAFCATLLRQRPVEACVDPEFREMDAVEARAVFSRVFRQWLRSRMDRPSEALRRAFAREAWKESRTGPVAELENAAWALAEWRDFDAPWRKDPFDRAAAARHVLVTCENALADWPQNENS
ncbi:MAG TPA: UvrD-helicase domain-containing protein, partial [Bryobacteraceae bacterium]|nr:UvrD-helicase domain-containing protein [Bryobacteraceae bacterium]